MVDARVLERREIRTVTLISTNRSFRDSKRRVKDTCLPNQIFSLCFDNGLKISWRVFLTNTPFQLFFLSTIDFIKLCPMSIVTWWHQVLQQLKAQTDSKIRAHLKKKTRSFRIHACISALSRKHVSSMQVSDVRPPLQSFTTGELPELLLGFLSSAEASPWIYNKVNNSSRPLLCFSL